MKGTTDTANGPIPRRGALFVALALSLLATPAFPATFDVNSTVDAVDCNPGDGIAETAPGNGLCTLRAAIMEANALEGDDVVNVPAGTYALLYVPGSAKELKSGGSDLDITDTLTITGAGETTTIVDGGSHSRAFDVHATAYLSDLTVVNCFSSGNGGALANRGTASLTRCTVKDSTSGNSGGGLYNYADATITLDTCTFQANECEVHGGGFENSGTATVTACTFIENVALGTFSYGAGMDNGGTADVSDCTFTANNGRSGGGLNNWGTLNLSGCLISGNVALGAAGMMIYQGTVTLTDCTFSDNHSTLAGAGALSTGGGAVQATNCTFTDNTATTKAGAVYNGSGTLTASGCILRANEAGTDGGALSNGTGTVTILNSTFSENKTGASGGGIYNDNGSLQLVNCTLVGNIADTNVDGDGSGGGIARNWGTAELGNCIVAGNVDMSAGSGSGAPDLTGEFTSLGHSIVGDATGCVGFTDGVTGDLVGTSAFPVDPLLGPLADNGGSTPTYNLLPGSPAIDAGDNSLISTPPFIGPPYYDQRGTDYERVSDADHDGNAAVDIGALEIRNPFAPLALDDSYTVDEGATLTADAPGVLWNDMDERMSSVTVTCVDSPAHGLLNLHADGSFSYTHDDSETTSDSFTYRCNDGYADGNVATVTITIDRVNDAAPEANHDTYTMDQAANLSVPAPGVLENDTDADGDSLTAVLVTDPSHGTVTLNPDGSFTYTHDGDASTMDAFTYQADDGLAQSYTAVVTITIDLVVLCDVSGDLVVNAIDVQLTINAALGMPGENPCDVNGDGTANALDVQLVINEALGL